MFGKQRVANVMHKRLPSFPRPDCAKEGCDGKLQEPRPFHTEQQGALGVLKVHCLGICNSCGAHHAGVRNVGQGKATRALNQEFHLYGDDDKVFVESLLLKYQQNTPNLKHIQHMPVID